MQFGITWEGTDMGRHSLRIIMVLGVLMTLVGGTGIFAVFTDRAMGGDNTVTSGTRPKSADLRIEPAVLDAATGAINCDGDAGAVLWQNDDTTTAQYTVADVQPGNSLGDAYFCLKNVGSAVLMLTASAIDVVDVDTDCTGDEAASGDTSCGLDVNGGPQVGELSPLLTVEADRVECSAPQPPTDTPIALDAYSAVNFDGLGPDGIACFWIQMAYPTPATDSDAQVAQSDTVSWRFAFDGRAQ